MPYLMNIFGVAGSAQSQRLNVTASNLANADSTTGPDGQPYKAKQVVFAVAPLGGARTASGQQVGGVQVTGVVDDPTPMKTAKTLMLKTLTIGT
ncbi:MAG: Flagellar basal-body rod protein FlgC [uncultured Paraburkholderia sp.]|nr:MAG: Flagellar basal-body rod protein FlgC [uncultured Paraburkholderia sp.]